MSRTISSVRLPLGGIFIPNADFEVSPPFTAATNVANVFIDGTAAGSTANESYGWTIYFKNSTVEASFDTTNAYAGSTSLEISTKATASQIVCSQWKAATTANAGKCLIRVLPSTDYTVRYRMKTNYVSGDSTSGAHVRVRTWTAAAGLVATTSGTAVKTTVDWTEYSIAFTTGATAVWVSIEPIIIGDTGTATLIMDAWYDTISLTPTTATSRSTASSRSVATGRVAV
ncbi:MAG: hypothetical protein LC803_09340 [Acidobacteria bacterium]|nr:hypothetical protein [Acidobacteriota bacterium]